MNQVKFFRPLAIAVEVIPLLFVYIYGVVINNDSSYLLALFPLASLVYLLFGWYIFKAEKFKTADIVLTIVAGIYFLLCSLTIIFFLESWTFSTELALISLSLGVLLDVYLFFQYKKRKDNSLEFRFSLKLLSRLLLFQVVIFYLIFNFF